ncbi:Proteasome subunit beta type-7 [Coelomomyces lativittatus]|nr:Proteasome subunit beta type-7 [Coelomomyces lativittatus]
MLFSYLAAVDFRGVTYSGSSVATGFGAHLAQPILRNALNGGGGGGSPGMEEGRELTLTETEASDLLDQVMRVLYYRDARSLNRIQKAIVSRSLGVVLSKPFSLSTDWQFAEKVRGYGSVKE